MKNFVKKYGEDKKYLAEIVQYYVETDHNITMEEVANHFGISLSNVKAAIRISIIRNYVPFNSVVKAFVKSSSNQEKYTKMLVTPKTQLYYTGLIQKRYAWLKEHITEADIREVMRAYVNNEYTGLSLKELNLYIERAVVYGIATDEEVFDMFEVNLKKIDCPLKMKRTIHMLERLLQLRSDVQDTREKLREIEEKLHNYDSVYGSGDEAPSKKDLEDQKGELEDKLRKLLSTEA